MPTDDVPQHSDKSDRIEAGNPSPGEARGEPERARASSAAAQAAAPGEDTVGKAGQAADPATETGRKNASQREGESSAEDVIAVIESEPERAPVTRAVRGLAAWSWRLLVIVAAAVVVLFGAMEIKTVVVPVLVAALIAALLVPMVNWMARHHIPRVLAVIITLLTVVIVIGGLLTLAGASIASGIQDLSQTAWEGIQDVLTWFTTGPLHLSEADIETYVNKARDTLEQNSRTVVSGALSVGTSVGHVLAGSLITLFCLFFFLKDGNLIWDWVVRLFPRVARQRVHGAGERAWVSLRSYARTQVIVAFCDGVGIGLGAWILGVPLAFPLGVLVFVGSFIPILGAFVTGFVAVAVALVSHGVWTAVIMLGVVLLVQQAESHLLQPLLMGHALELHPVAVLLSVATGTLVGGVIGALFAVPIAAVANSVLHYLNGGSEPEREMPRLLRRVQARRG